MTNWFNEIFGYIVIQSVLLIGYGLTYFFHKNLSEKERSWVRKNAENPWHFFISNYAVFFLCISIANELGPIISQSTYLSNSVFRLHSGSLAVAIGTSLYLWLRHRDLSLK